VRDGGPLEWIGVDSAIRREAQYPSLVIHAWGWWSRERYDDSDDALTSQLLTLASTILGEWVRSPHHVQLQRWKFGGPVQRLDQFYLLGEGLPALGACGDFGPVKDSEGAWRSGTGLADALTEKEAG